VSLSATSTIGLLPDGDVARRICPVLSSPQDLLLEVRAVVRNHFAIGLAQGAAVLAAMYMCTSVAKGTSDEGIFLGCPLLPHLMMRPD
jgi:hypothetical protein